MTELERQLMAALETLSGQYETERQRHFWQVEALQQRFEQQAAENRTLRQRVEQQAAESATLRQLVEHFGGQLMRLTADYRTLAETLRGRCS